ncbi:hypothetical protein WA026_002056 [Henosepilachna vigintioctopunctata]|uniref:Uncharacterized protein n=1 Tax=Henosepilachna vigintioctopunctata TaxID=420089 RepID=A0AAW1URP7_9CUCU
MKNHKGASPDNIPSEVWKLLKIDGAAWLTELFTSILEREAMTDAWRSSILSEQGVCPRLCKFSGKNQFGLTVDRGTTDPIYDPRFFIKKQGKTRIFMDNFYRP